MSDGDRGAAPRVLLLGATGRLGRAVVAAAQGAPSGEEAGSDSPGADVARAELLSPSRAEHDLSVADLAATLALLDALRPVALINAAAVAAVDACEEPDSLSWAVNAVAPGVLAEAAAARSLPLLHLSTDYVFGADAAARAPFAEQAEPAPMQAYGHAKAEGERRVRAAGGRAAVIRVSWLFGPTASNYADFVLAQARGGASAVAVQAEQRSRPTSAPQLARWLLDLADHAIGGASVPEVLHPAGGPAASRAQWARHILDAYGFAACPVVAQVPAAVAALQPAARPDDSRLDGAATAAWARRHGLPGLADWREEILRLRDAHRV